ncbi:MAG: hypothetical protein JO147_05325 [Actinobacteria bacterium]|nr:hypothetical protein [Actinomycetota bacterium]
MADGSGPDLDAAVDELYAHDPAEFTERRRALVAKARQLGDGMTAKRIEQLRKPTRSAWIVNALARSEPDLIDELVRLGDQLRAAERDLDGAQLRELSRQRRALVDSLARKAFTAAGVQAPTAALSDDILATFTAALADSGVAEQLRSGILVRPARWDGFGTATGPDLAVVPVPVDSSRRGAGASSRSGSDSQHPSRGSVGSRTRRGDARQPPLLVSVSQTPASREQARRDARRAEAQSAVNEATGQLEAAEKQAVDLAAQVDELDQAYRLLTEQRADAKRQLDSARLDVRYAQSQVTKARKRLERG